MKTKTIHLTFCILLAGCTYRYGTRSFVVDGRKEPEPDHYPMTLPSAEPVATSKAPCTEEGVKTTKLEVTNKIDSVNQTLTTTAVTETHVAPPDPCP